MPAPTLNTQAISEFIEDALDEDFIVIESEPKGNFNSLMQKVMGDVTTASAGRQVAIGGVTGCVAGYLTNRVGRVIGLSLAGTFILFQVAQHKGYVKVDWSKVQRAMTKAKAQARLEQLKLRQASVTGKIRNFVEENFFLSTGFMGGFAVGFFF